MKKIIILFLAFSFIAAGRPVGDKTGFYDFGAKMNVDNVVISDLSADSSSMIFVYKIPFSALAFRKYSELDDSKLVAYPKITIEVRDSNNIIRRSAEINDTIFANHDDTKNRDSAYVGVFNTRLKSGIYKAAFRLETQNNTLIQKVDFPQLTLENLNNTASYGRPIMAYIDESETKQYQMYNLSGAVGFNSMRSFILVPCSFAENQSFFKYEIKPSKSIDPERELVWQPQFSAKGEIEANSNEQFSLAQDKSAKRWMINIEKAPKSSTKLVRGLIHLELPFDQIVPGEYTLTLRNVSTKDSIELKFRIEWENMPFALRKPEYAADMLYYILKDDKYDEIKSGSKNEIFNKIVKYWREADPTPGTNFNEAMNAYFQRVDFASMNYNTFSETDGAKTDRGKVYILYGTPSKVSQTTDGQKKYEIWEYRNLNRKITFELLSNAIYKIIKDEALSAK